MKFETKDEYVQYRKNWKIKYQKLSQTIRDKKWMRNRRNYAWSKAWIEHGIGKYSNTSTFPARFTYVNHMLMNDVYYQELVKKYKDDMTWLENNKESATNMIIELQLAKQEARNQYLKLQPA